MATPPSINLETILQPIPADPPSVPSLERESVYFQFRQALRGGEVAQPGPRQDETRTAELNRLIEVGKEYVARISKDLVVGAWIVEALTQTSGFAGLRDGLLLMHGLISQCWDDCSPRLGPDDDPELRARPFEGIASERSLILCLRRVPLADPDAVVAPFSYLGIGDGPPGRRPAPTEADLTTGPIVDAINGSSRRFYEQLADDLREAAEADVLLGREVKKRFQADAPDLRPISRALTECQRVVDLILVIKGRQGPGSKTTPSTSAPGSDRSAVPPTPDVPGPTAGALDRGRVLIEFLDRARVLADAAARLKENREKYENLKEEMKTLDVEYEEITERIARDENYQPLLARTRFRFGESATAEGPAGSGSE